MAYYVLDSGLGTMMAVWGVEVNTKYMNYKTWFLLLERQ